MYLSCVCTARYESFFCTYSTCMFHSHVYTVRVHVSFICMYDTFCFKKPNHQKEKKNNFKLKLFPLHSITLRRNRNDKYPNIKDLKTTSFNIPPEVETQSSQHFLSSFPKFLFLWVPRIRPSPYPSQHFVSISPLRVCSRPCRRLTFAWSSS